MPINREELAAMIYAQHYAGNYPSVAVGVSKALEQADGFLKEAAKQREPKACEWMPGEINPGTRNPEPPKPKLVKSNHAYLPDEYGDCVICGRTRHEPDPKPERVARFWWAMNHGKGRILAYETYKDAQMMAVDEKLLFRICEVLE